MKTPTKSECRSKRFVLAHSSQSDTEGREGGSSRCALEIGTEAETTTERAAYQLASSDLCSSLSEIAQAHLPRDDITYYGLKIS